MSSFFSPYRHQFIRVGACVPAVAPAEPERNAAAVEAMLADADRARVALMVFPELCLSAYAIDDLLISGRAARRGRAPARAAGRGEPRALSGVRRRRAVARAGAALQLRGRDPSRAGAGRGPEGLSAELPRILRAPAFRLGRRHRRPVDRARRSRGPVRRRSVVRRQRRCGGVHLSRRDLRGSVGAAAAQHRGGDGRGRDPAQPVGQQHHDRQGPDAPPAMRLAVGALPGRLRLFGRGRRRVDDRPRLGRPGRDLRNGRGAGRDRALLGRRRRWPSPTSISAAFARSACAPTPLATARARQPARRPRRSAPSRSTSRRPASGWPCAATSSAFPMCRPTRRC